MSDQQTRSATIQRPTTASRDEWKAYWMAQGMPWRIEPEVDAERQRYLAERQDVVPYAEPFKDAELSRADIEWLLARHQSGGMQGPVDWSDERQRGREGLHLRDVDLRQVDLENLPLARTDFRGAHLEGALLIGAHMEGSFLEFAHLEGAFLSGAHLELAHLIGAHLEHAVLMEARFEKVQLGLAHLEDAMLEGAHLDGADLGEAFLNRATYLKSVTLDGTHLADVHWSDVNLALVQWSRPATRFFIRRLEPIDLGDTRRARQRIDRNGKAKDEDTRLEEFETAVRANRQLASILRSQGLNEDADRFAYQAQHLQRQVFQRRRLWTSYTASMFLDILAGYGYKPMRAFFSYALVIVAFMGLYLLNSQFASPHLTWDEALVLSMSSFHGRGFFNSGISLGDTFARLAAVEAFVGLLIEITFIATFTQRFFAR